MKTSHINCIAEYIYFNREFEYKILSFRNKNAFSSLGDKQSGLGQNDDKLNFSSFH